MVKRNALSANVTLTHVILTHVYTQAICEYTCVEPLWVGNKFCHVGWTLLLFGVWCKWHVLLDMWLEVAEEMPQIPQMKISTKPQGL